MPYFPTVSDLQELLIIGYGNTLRRDDGVGPKVAEAVAALNLPGVQAIVRHQLVPELAGPISQARAVVFVDADAKAAGEAELRPIMADSGGQILAHATDPRSLLALAEKIFGRNPQAWLLAIPVEDLGIGDGLSPRAAAGFQIALKEIQSLALRLVAG
jgi:hydrogenase maturation protease